MLQRAAGRTVLIHDVSIGPHWFFRQSEADSFFLLFSQPSYFFAVQSHRWLMQMVCSLQETLYVPYPACGCSVPLFLAPFPLERWLFPSALPRVVVLRHKPEAHAAVLTSCFLLTRRCCGRHSAGSTHQPLHTSCIFTPSWTQRVLLQTAKQLSHSTSSTVLKLLF